MVVIRTLFIVLVLSLSCVSQTICDHVSADHARFDKMRFTPPLLVTFIDANHFEAISQDKVETRAHSYTFGNSSLMPELAKRTTAYMKPRRYWALTCECGYAYMLVELTAEQMKAIRK